MKRFTFLKTKALIFSVLSLGIFPFFAMEMNCQGKKTVRKSKNSVVRDGPIHKLIKKLKVDERVYSGAEIEEYRKNIKKKVSSCYLGRSTCNVDNFMSQYMRILIAEYTNYNYDSKSMPGPVLLKFAEDLIIFNPSSVNGIFSSGYRPLGVLALSGDLSRNNHSRTLRKLKYEKIRKMVLLFCKHGVNLNAVSLGSTASYIAKKGLDDGCASSQFVELFNPTNPEWISLQMNTECNNK